MPHLMRCPFCGLLQDEPPGVKECARCGGGLDYERLLPGKQTYLQVQMELDQVAAPAHVNLERYLLVTIRTPAEVPLEEKPAGTHQRPPLNFAAVLDVSGSMQGAKIDQAKQAVARAAQYLHPGDVFSLVTFSNEVHTPFAPSLVDSHTVAAVKDVLSRVHAGGMTALCAGLETGIASASLHPQDSNLVLLLSDGQANVGETDLEKVGYRAFQARQAGKLVSTLGVGMDYNEALMAEIATQGGGRFYHVQHADQIPAFLAGELGEVASLAARAVTLQLEVPPGATLIPLSAAYPVQQVGAQAVVTVGDIPCDTELEIPLRLALLAQAPGARLSVHGSLSFRSPAGHQLESPVNRVTVRFLAPADFKPHQGVVQPVVERVFAQKRAASVLHVSRAQALHPHQAQQQQAAVLADLQAYAGMLGEERAEAEMKTLREQLDDLAGPPAASKQAVYASHQALRKSKNFGS